MLYIKYTKIYSLNKYTLLQNNYFNAKHYIIKITLSLCLSKKDEYSCKLVPGIRVKREGTNKIRSGLWFSYT
jgi:hypothetical protein